MRRPLWSVALLYVAGVTLARWFSVPVMGLLLLCATVLLGACIWTKARPILLEPYADVEIHVPERFTGDVAGNLSSSRGRMSGMEMHDHDQVIKAQVPLKEMQDYATHLRSITAGEGTFSMRPSHYEMVPPLVQQEIVAAYKRDHQEPAPH